MGMSTKKNQQKGRAAAVGLNREKVVAAALHLIDENGLAAFSLRELSRRLKVSTAVIYWHVGGKQEDLFAEISAYITREITQNFDDKQIWQARIRSIFQRYRELLHQHPNVSPLLGAQMKSNGVANLIWIESIFCALDEAGFKGDDLRDAFNALIGGLAGFVTMELAPSPKDTNHQWRDSQIERVTQIDVEQFPYTYAAIPKLSNQIFVLRWQNGVDVSYNSSFETLLDLLIEGLEYRASKLEVSNEGDS